MDGNCPFCDYEGDTYMSWANHYRQSHDRDEYPLVAKVGRNRLVELYSEYGAKRIADKLGVTKRTVYCAFDAADIETRTMSESWELRRDRGDWTAPPDEVVKYDLPVHNFIDEYSVIHADGHRVPVHRLCAVAWFGLESIEGKVVHHESEIPWDNREENLEPMTKSDHWSHHMQKWWDDGVNKADPENRVE